MSDLGDILLNVAQIVESSRVCGPGSRFVIWVQGCRIRCRGCWAADYQSMKPKKLMRLNDLVVRINNALDIEGITIVGGEPLHQARALLPLVKTMKKKGLTVMLYTGYEAEEITYFISKELITLSDIVVFGRYIEEKRSLDLKWRGSTNQRIVFHNPAYEEQYQKQEENGEVEIHIKDSGEILLLGYPEQDLRKEVIE